jgi:hypothetical protein
LTNDNLVQFDGEFPSPGFAADPQMGTWKLNEAKSKFTLGVTKNTMVVYEVAGDQVKVTSNGVDAKGKSRRARASLPMDGQV